MESDPQDADAYRLAGDFLTAAFFLLDLPSFKFLRFVRRRQSTAKSLSRAALRFFVAELLVWLAWTPHRQLVPT